MSVDNLTMLHTAALGPLSVDKPKLAMMLPDPSRYSPKGGSPIGGSPISTSQQGYFDHRPELRHSHSFSLPPIRELLKDTSTPVATPARVSQVCVAPLPQQQQQQQQQQQIYHQPQPFHLTSVSPPPPTPMPHQMGRSSSLPNYLAQQGRVPSPGIAIYHPQPHQYPLQHVHVPNMMPTPESRSESASPVSDAPSTTSLSMPTYGDANKDAKLSSRKKRQNLPRQTTMILLSWLSEHLDRPYPNSREKYELLMKTRLTIQQLDNWFINARRRKINELRRLKENEQSIALMF